MKHLVHFDLTKKIFFSPISSFRQHLITNGSKSFKAFVEEDKSGMIGRIFIVFVILPAMAITQTPCSNYWQYVRQSKQVEGLLTLRHDSRYSNHHVRITLTVAARLPSVSIQSKKKLNKFFIKKGQFH